MGKTHKADRLDSKIIQAVRHVTLDKVKSVVQDVLATSQHGLLDHELLVR